MDTTDLNNGNFQYEYGTLLRFLSRHDQRGYIFAMADDQRYITQVNANLVKDLNATGLKTALLYLQPESDHPLFYQVRQAASGNNALIIANLYTIVDNTEKGTDRLVELNFARESFWELGIPVLFWADKTTLNLIANKAPDLFSQRRLSTVHFAGIMDGHIQQQIAGPDRQTYIDSERFKELETETQLLEKRLEGAKAVNYHIARIVSEIALPLAKTYAEMGLKKQAQHLLTDYKDYLEANEDTAILQQVAEIHTLLHDYDDAIAILQKANNLLVTNTAGQEKVDPYFLRQIAYINYSLGDIYNTIGKIQEALQYFEKYNQIYKSLIENYPDDQFNCSELAISYSKLGDVHEKTGDFNKALEYYHLRNELGKQLYETNPRDVSFKNGLAISYEKLGGVYEKTGDLNKALDYYQLRNELGKQLHETNPRDASFKNGLAISYFKLGGVYEKTGDLKKALEYYEDEIVLFKQLNETNPRDVSFKNGLAISYSKIGDVYEETGDLKKALEYYEDEIVLFKQLHEANPRDVSFKNGLAVSYSKLGANYEKQNNPTLAKEHYLLAHQLWKEITTATPGIANIENNLKLIENKLSCM